MKSNSVLALQEKLVNLGYPLKTDGDFGNATYNAVVDFQKKNQLGVDGVVGNDTIRKIDSKIMASANGPLIESDYLWAAVELNADVVIGKINVVNSDNIVVNKDYTIIKPLTLFTFYLWGIPHQGTLIKRTLQLENLYDESYKINSDFKFFLKVLILENRTIQYIEHTISNYDNSGISSTNNTLQIEERKKIFAELIPERIRMNYDKVFPHYYEVTRIKWLLEHPMCYRIYRNFVTLCRKINL